MINADASNTIRALHNILSELPNVIDQTLNQLAEIGVTNAKSSTLFKNRSGNLRKNIKFINDGAYAKTVIADTTYAGYVEFGNNQKGPRIYPVKAKALKFQIDGQTIFRKWVKSHGPLPFMGNARELMISFVPDLFNSAIERLIERHSK